MTQKGSSSLHRSLNFQSTKHNKIPFHSSLNILLAPDSFKGSLGAGAVITAITQGLHRENKNINVISHPMADGGEGSLAILEKFLLLKKIYVSAHDALFKPIKTYYLFSSSTRTAYIELAKVSGLTPESKHTGTLHTTTFGTGELIAHALKKGAKTIYLLAGGSATTDGGIGIAGALGFSFATNNNDQNQKHSELLKKYELTGKYLSRIKRILPPNRDRDRDRDVEASANNRKTGKPFYLLTKTKFILISDVDNPLYGKQGAAYVFGPQKGANKKALKLLDEGLQNLGTLFGKRISQSAGSGAAGGVGGGAKYFLRAKKMSGIDFFIQQTALEKKIIHADVIISGEGRLDSQTLYGKVVSGVAKLARKHHRPLVLVCGQNTATANDIKKMHPQAVYTLLSYAPNIKTAITTPRPYLIKIGREIALSLTNKS